MNNRIFFLDAENRSKPERLCGKHREEHGPGGVKADVYLKIRRLILYSVFLSCIKVLGKCMLVIGSRGI